MALKPFREMKDDLQHHQTVTTIILFTQLKKINGNTSQKTQEVN